MPRLRRASAVLTLAFAFACGLLWSSTARAVDEKALLPVDDAFALSASAPERGRIELRWRIASGYYLYRHRIAVQPGPEFRGEPLQLPAGHRKHDEFFGEVETYRGSLLAVQPGTAADGVGRVTLKVKYQGCADVGVCYPPQVRTVTVALPAAGTATGADGDLAALGRSLAGRQGAAPLLGAAGGATDAMPLAPEQAFVAEAIAADGNTLLLRFTPAPGYYLYRDKTSLALDAGAGIALGAPRWPPGTPHRDEHFGEVIVYFDQVEVPVPLRRQRTDAFAGTLTVGFQGCQTGGICYPPMTRRLPVAVPAGRLGGEVDTRAPGGAVQAALAGAEASVRATPAAGGRKAGPVQSPAAVSAAAAANPPVLRGAGLTILGALLAALLGGLVLNLMPCVLPVLSLKAMSLVGNGQDPRRAREHALWYTAGVLLSFAVLGALALGLRQTGQALGWGFQLQQPLVVAVLGLVMLALGLSLSGLWQAGGSWTGVGDRLARRSGPAGDFFTGVLAVVVATPCTAPFMGAALAWAFAAPAALAMAVFLTLGLGLALPFVLVGLAPRLVRFLPRPGAWMDTLKQVLAFPLYLTAAWLAWVLGRQRGVDAVAWWLLAAVAVAFAAWAWTHARRNASRWAGIAAALAVFAIAWPLLTIQKMPRPAGPLAAQAAGAQDHVAYSAQRLADLRAARRVVFVNVTADWCVTCKANEKTVFGTPAFRDALAAANAVYMVGDWTDVDPDLTAFLRRYDAVGVPLYVVLPADGGPGTVLPTVLTMDKVRAALRTAAGPAP